MSPPTVSVILSVYNGERYLNESIDSVLNQQFGDFEFLIYDAGSTDNTAAIVESKKDTRIKFLRSTENQGLSLILNKLIATAKGKYIRLWSCDDIMKPHCLATEINFYKHNPELGFCYSNCDTIDERGRFIPPTEIDETPTIISPQLATQLMFYWGCLPASISAAMINKEVLEKTGGFDTSLFPSTDFDLWVRIAEKYSIGFIKQPLIILRYHRAQLSKSKKITLVIMKENRQIYERLLKRMPAELISYAREYHRRYVYVQYFHNLVSNFLRGHKDTALKIFAELRKYDRVLIIFWFWLFTLGGKRLNPHPKIKESADL